MKRKYKSHFKLKELCTQIFKNEIFTDIRHYNVIISFSSVQLGDDAWADCTDLGNQSYRIRVNASLKYMDVPEYVLRYLIGHELIHMLPGCWAHNDKFRTMEFKLVGQNYYDATVWLKRHIHLLNREYQYRKRAWLVQQVKDQLRIKDMAAICGCSISTIKRWLRKYDLEITYED
jgi:hypothetical protein